MPDDLRLQIEPIHQAVAAMGWLILMVEGAEADDDNRHPRGRSNPAECKRLFPTGDKDPRSWSMPTSP